jgi:hypothetical protein
MRKIYPKLIEVKRKVKRDNKISVQARSLMVFYSGFQPGVCVPLGVVEKLTGGTSNLKSHSK